jgi:Fe-S-cluster containining protein
MPKMNVPALVRRAHQKKKTLGLFLKKLAKKKPANLQKLIKEADKETWAKVDCLECNNCCLTMTPTFTKPEIKRIAERVGMTYDKYFDKYLKVDEDNGDIVNKNTPCQHLGLKDGKCKVYDIRPGDCAGFPHLVRKDFVYQVGEKLYENNMPRCPATLKFVENLERIVAEGK